MISQLDKVKKIFQVCLLEKDKDTANINAVEEEEEDKMLK